ncbi:MAG: LPS-assembly protein LptD, partial [Gammaproteobacteria bacterium]|nr:LPS-assembly protein LptD [Gammaproteobacteria bacterium]
MNNPLCNRTALIVSILAYAISAQAHAEATSCPQASAGQTQWMPTVEREQAPLSIDADAVEIQGKNQFIYQGNVKMERADQSLRSDRLLYNHSAGTLDVEGNLRYQQKGLQLQGERAHFNTKTEQATIDQAHYLMEGSRAQGNAQQIEMDGPYINRYHQATYTTCEEKSRGWELEAEQVELNELEGWGSATNAVVRFHDVPIFYSSRYSFPLDERRKSGFLFPGWGYNQQGGADVTVPYYWNIAPNQDATLTPRIISKRGAMVSGEYRYLNSLNQGTLKASYLADDELRDEKRYQFSLNHQGSLLGALTQPLSYNIRYATLSDRDYLTDFGNNLELASADTLLQSAVLHYQQGRLKLSAEITDHYTLSNLTAAEEPYRKLPQIDLSWDNQRGDDQLNYGVEGQVVRFDHQDSSQTDADRFWLRPSIDYRHTLLNGAAYLQPAISLAHTHYELDGGSGDLTIPHYSLESGLFLERAYAQAGEASSYLQTLEPSIRFNYIPDGRDSGQNFDSL